MSILGVNFSTVTRSRVIKDKDAVFYGLWIVNSVSKATNALIMSGVSVSPLVASAGDIVVPKNTKSISTELTEVIKFEKGLRCPDGIYFYFPSLATSGCSALIAFS